MPFSAGTIILQVVPSYLGFQDENKKMADSLAKSLDESLEKGASSGAKKAARRVNEILGEELGKDADKTGSKAAEDYAGSFRTTLENAIKKMEKELKPIELRTASSKTLDDLAKVKASLDELSKTKIEPGMDTRGMEKDLAKVTSLLDEMRKNADIDVKWDVDEATKSFESFKKKVDSYKPKIEAVVEAKFESKMADREIGAFEQQLKKRLKAASSALGDGVTAELRKVKAQLEGLKTSDIGLDISATDAEAELNKLERHLAEIAATTTDIQVHADVSEALAGLESVQRRQERVNGQRATVKVDVDGVEKATIQLSLFDRLLKKVGLDGRDVANSFRFFNFTALAVAAVGAGLIPIFAALSGGAVGLGVAAIGAAAGLGILAIAFSGIQNAVSALNDQQDQAAKTQEDTAKRMKAAAQQVEDAQRSLARAREDAATSIEDAERSLARTVEDSALRQRDAAQRVKDAREGATEAIETALRRQQDAEQRLADSQRDAAKAQADLVQARKDAAKELENLADQRKRNELDQRQAVIDLFNATVENSAAKADPGATNLEKEQADINLKNAQLRLKELRDSQKEMDTQAAKGVDNSDKVKTAQDRVTDAIRDQKKAQEDLTEADKALAKQRLESARMIQDALEDQKRTIADSVQATEDSQRSLARTREDAAQSIEDAQRGLTRAQESYQESLKDTSSSAQKVKDAMDALGPAGKEFALFIHSLRDDFREIRDIVQAAFLPPLTEAIKMIMTQYGPQLKGFAGTMATVFGQLAVLMAQTFTNKDFQVFFKTIGDIAPIITKNFGTAFLTFLQAVANIAVAFAPLAVQMSEAFLGWSEAFLSWTQSEDGQKTMQDFIAYVVKVAPQVKDFFKAFVGAIVNLAIALAPYGEALLKGVTDFLNMIANMDPDRLGAITFSILAMVAGFQLLAGVISVISILAGSTLGLIALAVYAVVAAFVYFYNTNTSFKKLVDEVWPVIQKIFEGVFYVIGLAVTGCSEIILMLIEVVKILWNKVLDPFFTAIGKAAKSFYDAVSPLLLDIALFFADIGNAVKFMWEKVVWPILKTFATIAYNIFVLAITPAVEIAKVAFRLLGDGLKWVWDHVISPVFGWIMDKLGVGGDGKEKGGGLVGAFRSGVGLIKSIWEGIKEFAKKPVDFLVNTIMNKGIIGGFNMLAKHLPGLKEIKTIPWPPEGYASGGITDKTYGVRFGYSPGRDNQVIAVGGGEAILRPEATRALGSDWVNKINKRAKLFGVQGVANFLHGFKEGGIPGEVRGNRSGAGEWDRTTWRGKKFNYHMVRMLQAVEQLTGQTLRITQGSYSTSVSASGSTHAGGGAVDLGWPGGLIGSTLVAALRQVGIAAWHRSPSQGPWNHHIHGISIGDPTASPAAQAQVRDYYNGGNGLGGKDDGPAVSKDKNLLDKIKGGLGDLSGWVTDAIRNPVEYLTNKVQGSMDELSKKFGNNTLVNSLLAIPKKIIEGMSNLINKGLDFLDFSGGDTGPVKDMVKQLAENIFGWKGDQWKALDWLVQHESSWNPNAQNPSSSAFGLFQFLDGTWLPYGPKTSDPNLQAQYGLKYIKDRYGDPVGAKAFWEKHHWYADGGVVDGGDGGVPDNGTMMYDNGGYLPPGVTTVVNLTGKPEPVFTAKQFEGMRGANQGGDGLHYEPHFYNSDLTPDDVMDDFRFEFRRLGRGS